MTSQVIDEKDRHIKYLKNMYDEEFDKWHNLYIKLDKGWYHWTEELKKQLRWAKDDCLDQKFYNKQMTYEMDDLKRQREDDQRFIADLIAELQSRKVISDQSRKCQPCPIHNASQKISLDKSELSMPVIIPYNAF